MDTDRDRRLVEIVEAALREAPDVRASFLERACEGDTTILEDATELLRRTNGNSHFLTSWAAGAAAQLVLSSVSLKTGDRLGPYRIHRQLGAGGMAEVYEATDVRLQRKVAIKVLTIAQADAAARSRVLEEARMISRLTHPGICAVYDVGSEKGIPYLVMQLLEGTTLRQVLSETRPSRFMALDWAIQIVDALHHAHFAGIVHRDLKPENIIVTKAGAKLIDFGIAAIIDSERSQNRGGTLPYMAPEQLEGGAATPRTDLFAFGAILYELLEGRPAFTGATPGDVAKAVLSGDAPVFESATDVPEPLRDFITTCLKRSPEERWQSALDAVIALRWIRGGVLARASQRRTTWVLPLAIAAAVIIGVVCTYAWLQHSASSVQRQSVTFTVDAEAGTTLAQPAEMAVSPDGKSLAFVAHDAGMRRIYVRDLQQAHARPLIGTEYAEHPFWSPDSAALAFFANSKLKRVAVNGGPAVIVCDAPSRSAGTWGKTGTILFGGATGPVLQVNASGGTPEQATRLNARDEDDGNHWPAFLADGVHFLYTARSNRHEGKLYAAALGSTDATYVLSTPSQALFSQGLLYYLRGNNLISQPFNGKSLRVNGDTTAIAEHVGTQAFSVSNNGVIAYWSGVRTGRSLLTWVDRSGRELSNTGSPAQYRGVVLSPDGDNVIATVCDSIDCEDPTHTNLVRSYNLRVLRKDGSEVRFTTEEAVAATPLWSPHADEIVFGSTKNGHMDLYRRRLDSESETLLLPRGPDRGSTSWSRDGRYIAYTQKERDTAFDIWILDLATQKPSVFRKTKANETLAAFSPDGKWIAYNSDESGSWQIYIARFDANRNRDEQPIRISTTATMPIWRRDGAELYFYSGGKLMAVDIHSAAGQLATGTPRALFSLRYVSGIGSAYAPSADGSRFLILNAPPQVSTPITVQVR